ncbi:Serine/threonine-protein kinase SRPK [Fonsecaea pedrosoi]|nr:Serine/threonine-protein kinase SRPK [Fonsecaea pedrosoi]
MDAKSSLNAATELSILDRISECRLEDPLAQYILTTLDTFHHSGPNGTHLCLVSEPMGPSVASLAEELTPLEEWKVNISYPTPMAKRILRHVLRGLKVLHANGIVHADLQPGNLLVAISNIDQLSEEVLQQDVSGHGRNPAPEAVQRIDGLEDEWAPRYLFLGQSLVQYAKLGQELQVKISDFGAAFWSRAPPSTTVTPLALRSPELILGGKIGSSIDIWSFGCLIFELLTGVSLFSVVVYFEDDRESTDDEHILQMNDILEPLPDVWLQKTWTRAGKYFGPGRERLGPIADGQDEPYVDDPLELRFKEYRPKDIDDEEAGMITSLIRSILRYEPSQRPTAEELLKHSWFRE